jgi:hypothetical protein
MRRMRPRRIERVVGVDGKEEEEEARLRGRIGGLT